MYSNVFFYGLFTEVLSRLYLCIRVVEVSCVTVNRGSVGKEKLTTVIFTKL